MDFRQRLHDGRHQADAGAVIHGAFPLQFFQQCFALDEVHDDVGGLILDENGLDPDDTGNTAQLCHFPGFLQEAVEALFHAGFLHDGIAPHNGRAAFPADHAGAHGEVLFNGDLLLQQQIKADVGNAEAALPQHFAHEILPVQDRSGFQSERLRLHAAVRAAAFRADGLPCRQRVHTFHTSAIFHIPILFLV